MDCEDNQIKSALEKIAYDDISCFAHPNATIKCDDQSFFSVMHYDNSKVHSRSEANISAGLVNHSSWEIEYLSNYFGLTSADPNVVLTEQENHLDMDELKERQNSLWADARVRRVEQHVGACTNQLSETLNQRGTLKISVARYEEGLKLLDQAMALQPDNPKHYMLRGRLHVAHSHMNEAIKDFEAARQISSENATERAQYADQQGVALPREHSDAVKAPTGNKDLTGVLSIDQYNEDQRMQLRGVDRVSANDVESKFARLYQQLGHRDEEDRKQSRSRSSSNFHGEERDLSSTDSSVDSSPGDGLDPKRRHADSSDNRKRKKHKHHKHHKDHKHSKRAKHRKSRKSRKDHDHSHRTY